MLEEVLGAVQLPNYAVRDGISRDLSRLMYEVRDGISRDLSRLMFEVTTVLGVWVHRRQHVCISIDHRLAGKDGRWRRESACALPLQSHRTGAVLNDQWRLCLLIVSGFPAAYLCARWDFSRRYGGDPTSAHLPLGLLDKRQSAGNLVLGARPPARWFPSVSQWAFDKRGSRCRSGRWFEKVRCARGRMLFRTVNNKSCVA
jgi:hypothetical protein